MQAVLSDPEGKEVCRFEVKNGENAAVPVADPRLWSAEAPELYTLTLTAGEEVIGDKVGFRKIVVESGVVKINDVPVKFRGCEPSRQLSGNRICVLGCTDGEGSHTDEAA